MALGGGFIWGALMVRRQIFPFALIRALIRDPYNSDPAKKAIRDGFETYAPKADVVFIGDSIFSMIEWQDVFPDLRIAKRAIGGDTTADVLARLSSALATNAPIAILSAGANDALGGVDVNETVANIEAMQEAYPGKLCILSVLPCSGRGATDDRVSRIHAINNRLSRLPNYIDVHSLVEPGDLADGTHLNARGNAKLVEVVRGVVSCQYRGGDASASHIRQAPRSVTDRG